MGKRAWKGSGDGFVDTFNKTFVGGNVTSAVYTQGVPKKKVAVKETVVAAPPARAAKPKTPRVQTAKHSKAVSSEPVAAQTGLAGGVTIGDYAIVGGQVGVGDKARIESRAVIGSGAGILTAKIVRAGEPVWGTPARPLRQYLEQLATLARLAKRRGK